MFVIVGLINMLVGSFGANHSYFFFFFFAGKDSWNHNWHESSITWIGRRGKNCGLKWGIVILVPPKFWASGMQNYNSPVPSIIPHHFCDFFCVLNWNLGGGVEHSKLHNISKEFQSIYLSQAFWSLSIRLSVSLFLSLSLYIYIYIYIYIYSPSSYGEIVGESGLFNLGMATSLREQEFRIKTC